MGKQKLYTCTAVANLIERYYTEAAKQSMIPEVIELVEGCLGYGLTIIQCTGFKTAIIKEKPLNCWSSAHIVRFYNKTPKKYLKMIEAKEVIV